MLNSTFNTFQRNVHIANSIVQGDLSCKGTTFSHIWMIHQYLSSRSSPVIIVLMFLGQSHSGMDLFVGISQAFSKVGHVVLLFLSYLWFPKHTVNGKTNISSEHHEVWTILDGFMTTRLVCKHYECETRFPILLIL